MNYKYIKYKVFRLDGGASLTNEVANMKLKLEMATKRKKSAELANLKRKYELKKRQVANLKKQKVSAKVQPTGIVRQLSIPDEDVNTYNKYLDRFNLPDLYDKFMKYYQLKRNGRLVVLENNMYYAFLNIHPNTIQLTNSGLYINFKFNNQIGTLTLHKSIVRGNRIHLKSVINGTTSHLPIKVKMNQYGSDKTDSEISIINQQPSIFFTIAKNLINILNEFYKKLNEWKKLSPQEQIKLNYYW